ncbi:ATP-binding protein [Dokdonia ponticola]|uniref:Oxygen sensor histidine kinase NreB n=1 Tax=Dokdonia ponticola TaxID=2041041 RepID=A0ABV9HV52_9FLAO
MIILIELISVRTIHSQELQLEKIDSLIESRDLDFAKEYIEQLDVVNFDSHQKARLYYSFGKLLYYRDENSKSYDILLKSKSLITNTNDLELEFKINDLLYDVISSTTKHPIKPISLIKENCKISQKTQLPEHLYYCKYYYMNNAYKKGDYHNTLSILKEMYNIANQANLYAKMRACQINMGSIHNLLGNKDSTLYYYRQMEKLNIHVKDSLNLSYLYNNFGTFYRDNIQYDLALEYFYKADSIPLNQEVSSTKLIYIENIADVYLRKLDYKNAALQFKRFTQMSDSLNRFKQLKDINELEAKFQNAEKEKIILEQEKENLELEVKNKRSQTITYGLGAFLLLGSIIAFLVYRNTKRKQRIAEQDRELQIQKTETILKEKELETINAMVSGQEKERLRLAGELHDNIGSTLATVRMQVENLERNLDKVENPKALLQKANLLINETYEKVRGISHKSNSGVMAKEGLLPAVEKLARTVSATNQLAIDVQDFGLENRIPNELEITIFRIIQELVTNIVKHAQATEATISLTQHDNELNIMVEDNGKGFKVGKLEEKDGMGLGSIERRVEHLEGTMEVDSAQGRGTSVSIDIPIQ